MIASFTMADFKNSQPMVPLTSGANFDQNGFVTIREVNDIYFSEIGIYSRSRMSDDFVFISYVLHNNGSSVWPDMRLGIFADWDVGDPYSNFGGIDSARGLAYEYDARQSQADLNYYGVIALSRLSGASVMTESVSSSDLLSTISSIRPPTVIGDNRLFIGSGPYTVGVYDSVTVGFALVAGSDLADLLAHADSATALWKTKIVAVAHPERLPAKFALHQNYPNPFNPATNIDFEIPERSKLRIEVFNLLGQKVATLLDEERNPGPGSVQWAAAAPSGMYFYRIEAVPNDNPAKHYVDVKKMILLR
jgi:hypothetical protein